MQWQPVLNLFHLCISVDYSQMISNSSDFQAWIKLAFRDSCHFFANAVPAQPSQRFFATFYPSAMVEFPYYVPSNFPKIFVLVCTLELLSVQNPQNSGTILKNETLAAQVSLFLVESRDPQPMCACDATRLLGFLILKRIFQQGRIIRRAKSLSTFLVLFSEWCGNAMV